MTRERLYLFETTLREGAQTNGIDFTLRDKLVIAGIRREVAATGVVLKDTKDGATWEVTR